WIGILPAQYHIGVDCGIATGGWSRYFEALPRWSTCAEGQMGSFDIITLIFLALAVFVIFKLRSVLGERTGAEPPPPENLRRDPVQPTVRDEKIITLPSRNTAPVEETPAESAFQWQDVAEEGSALAAGFDSIAALDSSFEPRSF